MVCVSHVHECLAVVETHRSMTYEVCNIFKVTKKPPTGSCYTGARPVHGRMRDRTEILAFLWKSTGCDLFFVDQFNLVLQLMEEEAEEAV